MRRPSRVNSNSFSFLMLETAAKTKSLTAQTAWILTAKIISYALTIVVPLLLARKLNQTEFGLYKQVFLILITANALLPFSFGASAYYFLPRETAARRRAAVTNILLFHIAVGLFAFLLLFFYPGVLSFVFRETSMIDFAPVLGVTILFWIFSGFLETLVIANQEPKLAMIFIVFAQLTKAAFFIAAAVFAGSIESLVWAAACQAILQTVVLLFYVNLRFPGFAGAFDFGLFREQFSYTLPFGLGGWFYTMQIDLHNYFVTSRFAAAEYAVYAVGCFELPLIGILAESVSAVLIPTVSRLQANGDKREIIETTARVARKLAVIYFPLAVFLFVTADTFLTWLFTDKFAQSAQIFRVNITLLPFAVIVLDPITRAYKQLAYYLLRVRVVLFVFMTAALWYATATGNLLNISFVVVSFALIERAVSTGKILHTIGVRKTDFNLLQPIFKIAAASAIAGTGLFLFYNFTAELLPRAFSQRIELLFNSFGAEVAAKLAPFAASGFYLAMCAVFFSFIYLILLNFFSVIEPQEKQKIVEFCKNRLARRFKPAKQTASARL